MHSRLFQISSTSSGPVWAASRLQCTREGVPTSPECHLPNYHNGLQTAVRGVHSKQHCELPVPTSHLRVGSRNACSPILGINSARTHRKRGHEMTGLCPRDPKVFKLCHVLADAASFRFRTLEIPPRDGHTAPPSTPFSSPPCLPFPYHPQLTCRYSCRSDTINAALHNFETHVTLRRKDSHGRTPSPQLG